MVVSITQSYNTEQRISTNDADHKYAAALAETALRAGENRIAGPEFEDEVTFTPNCTKALCSAANAAKGTFGSVIVEAETRGIAAWERMCGKKTCIEINGIELENTGAGKAPRHIIEYISTQNNGSVIYRVTAKAWGKNANTSVILQSYVQVE